MMPEQATPGETSNVLVVEDNPGQRETLCDILELEGFHTLACGSATEADQVIGQQPLAATWRWRSSICGCRIARVPTCSSACGPPTTRCR